MVDDEVVELVSGHTSDRMSSRIEVVARVSGRRAWTVEQKLTMLRDAFGPGGSVRASIERYPSGGSRLAVMVGAALNSTLKRAL